MSPTKAGRAAAAVTMREEEATGIYEEEPEEDDEGDPRVSNNFFPTSSYVSI